MVRLVEWLDLLELRSRSAYVPLCQGYRYLRHSGHFGRKPFLIRLIGKSHVELDQMA